MVTRPRISTLGVSAALALYASFAPRCRAAEPVPSGPPPAPPATVASLLTRDLLAAPGKAPDKEIVMLTVQYPAAGASLPHRHDAQVFVYVLEGQVTMQVRGSAAVTLNPGETFYEGPDDVHVVSANNSRTSPAKILVVMIKDKGKPASRPAD